MSVAENIRKIRKEKGLTQKQLGELCIPKIGESTIRKYELGLLNPKIETIRKIASALEMNLFEFIDDDYFDIATDEEPGSEANEIMFFAQKREAIKNILNNQDMSDKEKTSLVHDIILQSEIVANMHLEDARIGDMHLFEMCYDMLNEKGRDKAREMLLMLTKIPEYQAEQVIDTVAKAVQDGHISIVKKDEVATTTPIAAHNDHAAEPGELEKMQEDVKGLKRPED